MRALGVLPLVLLAAGASLIGVALANGGASLALIVVLPVLYGRSLEFVAGTLLLVAGIFTLPLLVRGPTEPIEEDPAPANAGSPGGGSGGGGLVLIGPIPIFFGGWSRASSRTRWIVAVIGAAVLAAAILLVVLA